MSNDNALDLHYVQQSFQRSLKEEDDVVVEAYIDGYNELVKYVQIDNFECDKTPYVS